MSTDKKEKKTSYIGVRIPDSIYDTLVHNAKKDSRNLSNYITLELSKIKKAK